jgi:hypothetical protein
MKSKIIEVLGIMEPERAECKADELKNHFCSFIKWKDDPKCPFSTCFNGIDKDRERVCYEKSGKHFTIDQVYAFWTENVLNK